MPIKQYPEWSDKYPAIDGIAKQQRPSEEEVAKKRKMEIDVPIEGSEKAIRSDIEAIINLDDNGFHKWYFEHENATKKLLELYELFGDIPDLRHGSDWDKCNIGHRSKIKEHIELLRQGLDYLKVIKQARKEDQKSKS